jgi:FAD/FMN-containing dehydrogenase
VPGDQEVVTMHDANRSGVDQVDQVDLPISKLRAAVTGEVITPDDPGYDRARTVFPGGIDRRPAVVVRPTDADDVSYAVSLARDTGAPLAVRSGGHSVFGVSDGGITLDLSGMRALDIDVDGRTAWAQTGLTAGEFSAAAGEHGLATGFGDAPSVGIGGITLGGGVGFLVRRYGLTIDDLLAADVVTADGRLVRADAREHPDLFWAIRGGGGNFGVATRLQLRLHEVGTVLGGTLVLPASAPVIAAFVQAAEAAPEELSAIANVMVAPPMPFLPAEAHGRLVLMATLVCTGDVEAGQQAVAPFRALATPILDDVRARPLPDLYEPMPPDYHPAAESQTMFIDTVDVDTAELIVEHVSRAQGAMAVTQLRVLGGAMARVPVTATAFAHRQRRIMVNVAAIFERPEESARHREWAAGLAGGLRERGAGGAYVNFLGSDGAERLHEAYPGPTWDRLVAVKRSYDPTNVFRLNHNISPGPGPH